MNTLIAAVLILVTILGTLTVGVLTSYYAVCGILAAFGQRVESPVLVPQTELSGD